MEKILTSFGNPNINIKLKELNKYIIQAPDIENYEEIIEILEEKKDTTIIIINFSKIKKEEIFNLIINIKLIKNNIKIIAIIEKENEIIKNILIENGIKDILIGNKISINELENKINHQFTNEEFLLNEINNLKKLINNKNNKKEKFKKYLSLIFEKYKNKKIKNNKIENNSKIICITGASGIGKSVFTAIVAKIIKNKKILIINLDAINNSIKTIFNSKEKNTEKIDLINLSKNIDLISDEKIIIENNKNEINQIINNYKNNYDLILIDTSSECFFEKNKNIIKNSDKLIFLSGANLIELKKTRNLLNIYINEWKIKKNKIKIIFNKYNKNSIDNNLLKEMFKDFEIIDYLKLDENYDNLINNNLKIINKEIKEKYEKIIEKIREE